LHDLQGLDKAGVSIERQYADEQVHDSAFHDNPATASMSIIRTAERSRLLRNYFVGVNDAGRNVSDGHAIRLAEHARRHGGVELHREGAQAHRPVGLEADPHERATAE
jgi:hypothetical protein